MSPKYPTAALCSSARSRLHEWAASGRIDGFALAYLGMKDDRLPAPPADLVPRSLDALELCRGQVRGVPREDGIRVHQPRRVHAVVGEELDGAEGIGIPVVSSLRPSLMSRSSRQRRAHFGPVARCCLNPQLEPQYDQPPAPSNSIRRHG